jgi:hypothetical protein
MTNRIGKIEQQGQGCFKWCIAGAALATKVMASPFFEYRSHTFSFAHQLVTDATGYHKNLKSSVVAAADAAGEYPQATFLLQWQCPHKRTSVKGLPVTISRTQSFSADAPDCGTVLSITQDPCASS